jgi:hypothetical protein
MAVSHTEFGERTYTTLHFGDAPLWGIGLLILYIDYSPYSTLRG